MIVFDLQCRNDGHVFEAWFRSNVDYEEQSSAGLVQCPLCNCCEVEKAPMAPLVPKAERGAGELADLAKLQADLLRDSEWVGDAFTETARAMHIGEVEQRAVHGQASLEQARALAADGVPVAPLPLPVVPPAQLN